MVLTPHHLSRHVCWRALALVALLGLAASSVACVAARPPVRYEVPARVALAHVMDPGEGVGTRQGPEPLTAGIEAELNARNLAPERAPSPLFERFDLVRDSKRRLQALAESCPEAEVVALVETRALFYSLLSGGYRWTVYVKISVGDRESPAGALSREFDLPAVLSYAHEKEVEAIDAVSDAIARKVAQAVDDHLGGRIPSTRPSAEARPQVFDVKDETGQAGAVREDESVYFVLVDRFRNGDPGNDADAAPDDPSGWHGGDLAGVIERVDYLHDLGVRTLWLSPIFKTRAAPFMGHGAFHGYWVEDLEVIDPRFGDEAQLRQLVEALHARGMRLLLDMVVNHVGYDAPLVTLKPDWFHKEGTIEDWSDPVQLVRREVHGLPDLDQSQPAVFEHLRSVSARYLDDFGIDGFRLDAVKHVPLAFWSRYNAALRDERPGVMLLGEMYDGSAKVVDAVQREGSFTHMFDFPTAFALRDVFCQGRPPGRLAAILSNDRFTTDADTLVTFLDNHDMPRIRSVCGGSTLKVKDALTAQLALRGSPSIYYGTEAGLQGVEEPANRADMIFDAPEAEDLKAHLKALLALRREHASLREGHTRLLRVDERSLWMIRALPDQAALLIIHSGSEPMEADLPPALRGATLTDALTGDPVGEAIALEPGRVRLLLATPEAPGGFAALTRTPEVARPVEVSVEGAALAEGESLVVVGSGPEIGAWDPASGFLLSNQSDTAFSGRLMLPAGAAFAFKLVVRSSSGQARWESGEDRYLFVDNAQGPLKVALRLRQ